MKRRVVEKVISMILVFSMVIMSSGCCSIFLSGSQEVTIKSNPEGANVEVGPFKGTTPYDVILPRGEDYYIKATYQGKEQSMPLSKKIEGLYWVNILFWPGLIVDIVTGKMFKYVPSDYEFDFTQ